MKTISICMIVRDEESTIARVLECASKVGDEIIIVDTGSTDHTLEIAKKYTNKIYKFDWIDNFSSARNFGIEKATMDYIMWLDADDVILQEDIEKILYLKRQQDNIDVYMCKYVFSHDMNYKPIFEYYRERIFKNLPKFRFVGAVHEVVIPQGEIIYTEIKIYHEKVKQYQSDRNLKIYQKLKKEGHKFTSREQFYYARELMQNGKFKHAEREYKAFLKREDAWCVNKKEAISNLISIYINEHQYDVAKKVIFSNLKDDFLNINLWYFLGYIFSSQKRYKEAISCFKTCLDIKRPDYEYGFVDVDRYDFLPSLELCFCYFQMGDIEKSKFYHKKCQKIHPDNEIVIKNQRYFESIETI